MHRLNASVAGSVSPAPYDTESTGIGIVHIGPGAFHRAHQAVFTEDALAFGGNWRICGVQMRSSAVRDALQPQNYRYTLAILDGKWKTRVIHSLANILVAAEDIDAIIELMAAPSTHIISLTITEKGYCLTPSGELDIARPEIIADLGNPGAPQSAIGLLAAALERRRRNDVGDVTVLSCDNLSNNGRLLETAVHQFAEFVGPSLKKWIEGNIAFPCTMVDSITPVTDDTLRRRIADATGYEDALPVSREAFCQWVIEDRFSGPRPAWDEVGVIFANDVAPFEAAKIRLLNGAHSALAYIGMLSGYSTVRDAVADPELCGFLRGMMLEEICPALEQIPDLNLEIYCDDILKRFRNPEIEYRLAQIAWDGSQKIRFRFFATIADNLKSARASPRLVFAVAAWLHFVVSCYRDGTEMIDPLRPELLGLAANCNGSGEHDTCLFLNAPGLFPRKLRALPEFAAQLADAYDAIQVARAAPGGAGFATPV